MKNKLENSSARKEQKTECEAWQTNHAFKLASEESREKWECARATEQGWAVFLLSSGSHPSENIPWQKYRIGIHSKSVRTIPFHSDICIWVNANHSEPIRKTFCISFDKKRSKINPTSSDEFRDIKANQSETKFSIQGNLNQFELGMIRIDSYTDIGLTRNSSDWLRMISNPILSPGLINLQEKYQMLIK